MRMCNKSPLSAENQNYRPGFEYDRSIPCSIQKRNSIYITVAYISYSIKYFLNCKIKKSRISTFLFLENGIKDNLKLF